MRRDDIGSQPDLGRRTPGEGAASIPARITSAPTSEAEAQDQVEGEVVQIDVYRSVPQIQLTPRT